MKLYDNTIQWHITFHIKVSRSLLAVARVYCFVGAISLQIEKDSFIVFSIMILDLKKSTLNCCIFFVGIRCNAVFNVCSLWSRSGCGIKEGNRTHTVCACNHMSTFAVAMKKENIVSFYVIHIQPLLTAVQNPCEQSCGFARRMENQEIWKRNQNRKRNRNRCKLRNTETSSAGRIIFVLTSLPCNKAWFQMTVFSSLLSNFRFFYPRKIESEML